MIKSLPYPLYIIVLGLALLAPVPDSQPLAQVLGPSPLDDIVESPLDDPLLEDVDSDLDESLDLDPIDEPLDNDSIDGALDNVIGEPLETGDLGELIDDATLGEPLDGAADAVIAPVDETLGEVLEAPATEIIEQAATALPDAAQAIADAALAPIRPFVEDVDPFGNVIEEDVLMVLLEPAALAKLERSGWPVTATRRFGSLGLVLVRIEGPAAPSLAQAAGSLRAEFPDAAVDYNFLYRFADADESSAESGPASMEGHVPPGKSLRLGLIDSAVAAEHTAFSGVRIVSRDFAPHEGERPPGHGTAIASILAASAGEDAEILAASVFFQTPGHAPGATTESLIAALDWLAGSDVHAINMSLAGPPDNLLERALTTIAADGPTVVAAVGNNGPAGEPLYPAAYESVVGVTAIDREQRIFPYASRGDQVAFAALGVNVKVADNRGSWRMETGTSMASPLVTVIIAAGLHASDLPRKALIESMKASAIDLGDEGFDPVFGYGLVQPPRSQNAAASLTE